MKGTIPKATVVAGGAPIPPRPPSPVHARLAEFDLLDSSAMDLLDRLLAEAAVHEEGTVLVREGEEDGRTRFLLDGWALRFQSLPGGERQIINFLIPGDTIGLYGALISRSDASVSLLTDARVAEVPCGAMIDLFHDSPGLGAAMCWIGGLDDRLLMQQLVRVARLDAVARIAHLLLELHTRLRISGATEIAACNLPLAQNQIADSLGMSEVHASRSCRRLRSEGLITTVNGSFVLQDRRGLASLCDFDERRFLGGRIPPAATERLLALARDPKGS